MEYGVSVIMPSYNQCAFIRRAIKSLICQTHKEWELIIINDGSHDETEYFIADFSKDPRITIIRNKENTGLGHALNQGIEVAKYEFIAYLPSDDYYYPKHLESLLTKMKNTEKSVLTFSGLCFDSTDTLHDAKETETYGNKKGYCLQLVQTLHKKTEDRWVEREEWISDDLYSMFWHKISNRGIFVPTGEITSYWTQHPYQRHRIINEKYGGGLNKVRSYYKIQNPIRLKVSKEKFIDEYRQYDKFRVPCPPQKNGLKILIVGELAYNPERIYALEQDGHQLYGLWTPHPHLSFSTIGPLPFGNVVDLPTENWQEAVSKINPDIIYCLLNCGAINWCYEVVTKLKSIPYVWHYKEGPQLAIRTGRFDKLIYLYSHAAIRIFINKEIQKWYELFLPDSKYNFVMDGDLPKSDYLTENYSTKFSELDGNIHILVAGRMIGISYEDLLKFSRNQIHVHVYLENFHSHSEKLFNSYIQAFPHTFHVHSHCKPDNWVEEFSKYDVGWLHCIQNNNEGNIMQATWDDLNFPARMSTYMAAGLPMVQKNDDGGITATASCIRDKDIGILYTDLEDLIEKLRNKELLYKLRNNVLHHRMEFCFDYYVPELISIFRKAICK